MHAVCPIPWLGESQSTSQGDAAALALRLQQLLAEREEAAPERVFLNKHAKMDNFWYFSMLFTLDPSCYPGVGIEPSSQIFSTPGAADAQLQESKKVLVEVVLKFVIWPNALEPWAILYESLILSWHQELAWENHVHRSDSSLLSFEAFWVERQRLSDHIASLERTHNGRQHPSI